MRFFIIPALLLATACTTLSEDTPGQVVAFNGDTVTVRGGFSAGQTASPTPAMVSQAKAQCSGAAYLSATPDPNSLDHFLYLFRC